MMERSRILQFPADLKPYELRGLNQSQQQLQLHHVSVTSKKWWLGFCCAVLGVLLLLYVPVYHQLQTRIGETMPGDLVGMHSRERKLCKRVTIILGLKTNLTNSSQ